MISKEESKREFGFEEAKTSGGSVFEQGVKESKRNKRVYLH